ncbi:hypothetical protein [Allorhodopirellula solitaria]|uniref:Uncharacterized protein n=1 Tax=Allorhodopirellula solitaria TaxID=2527987 RepID=A0A5C5XW47_9BACT|nr:hypothetical protein [Allorhodopirellula solitaria]TWT67130.1 hypothetical protein CA85_19760 [Allorhodopirellula solitaria]
MGADCGMDADGIYVCSPDSSATWVGSNDLLYTGVLGTTCAYVGNDSQE